MATSRRLWGEAAIRCCSKHFSPSRAPGWAHPKRAGGPQLRSVHLRQCVRARRQGRCCDKAAESLSLGPAPRRHLPATERKSDTAGRLRRMKVIDGRARPLPGAMNTRQAAEACACVMFSPCTPARSFIKSLLPACARVRARPSGRVSPLVSGRTHATMASLLARPDGQPAHGSETTWWFCSFEGGQKGRKICLCAGRSRHKNSDGGEDAGKWQMLH